MSIVQQVTPATLDANFVHTAALAIGLAVAVFALSMWRRVAGAILLALAFLLATVLFLEFADPAMAGGIEIAFGAQQLRKLRSLPLLVFGASLAAFCAGELLRARASDVRARTPPTN